MALSAFDKEKLAQDQQDLISEFTKKAQSGEMSWGDAHTETEKIRSAAGYSGGADGSGYNPASAPKSKNAGFSYESAPSYTNKYQSQIDDLAASILNRDAFSYDPEQDETYQQYKDSYTKSGQRAMQDTLGQVSARTGGLASSYAGSVSQQTYDNYMSALADKIPELKQLAYSMYQDEGDTQRVNLEMLQALESGDYAKYQDLLSQYNTDRGFDYGVYSDDKNFDYQAERDSVSDKQYVDETAYNRQTYEDDTEYSQALQKAQTLAAAGDFSGYKAMRYTDAEIANLKTAYDKAQAASVSSGSRSSSSGSGGSSGGSSGSSGSSTSGIVDTMVGMGSDTKAYEYLLGLDMSNAKTEQLWSMYETARDGSGSSGSTPSFGDYSQAVAYMEQNGVPGGNASGAMTKSEWARRKSSYQQYGQGGTEVTSYDSYAEYLTAYVQYCVETYGK